MKRLIFIAPTILLAAQAQALTPPAEMYLTSPVPRGEAKDLSIGVSHTFGTKILEIDDEIELTRDLSHKNFGLSAANVALTAVWIPINNVAVRAIAGSGGPNFQLGASGFYSTAHVSVDAGINLVVRNEDVFKYSALPFISMSSPFLTEMGIDLTVNIAYDSYNALTGMGFGLGYDATENHRVMAEYFPRISKVNDLKIEQGKENSFDFGYRYSSFGHQFFALLTNSNAIDMRQAIMGTSTNDLGLAFRVTREM